MELKTLVNYSGNILQLGWIFILWAPFVFTMYNIGSISQLYNQLTWWSWTIQCLFYTYMHFKCSIFYLPIRTYIYENYNEELYLDTPTIFDNLDMYIFGIVSGISLFVFFEFMYVLYHNPSLVYDESSQYKNQGIPQIGNIFIHYYIIAATPMWTVFNFRYLITRLENFTTGQSILFSLVWLLYLFIYVLYWKFDIYGIAKNYHIDDIPMYYNVIYILFLVILVSTGNSIYLFSIKEGIN